MLLSQFQNVFFFAHLNFQYQKMPLSTHANIQTSQIVKNGYFNH